jgi:transcriptional/translational regulatory protein YebC/TACO1
MLELALEAGAEDVIVEEEGYTIKTDIPSYIGVIENLKAKKIEIAENDITYYPKNTVPVDQATADAVAELVGVLDDLEDVQTVSSNEIVQ